MADTTFINGTVVVPAWLNDVNDLVYNVVQNGTGAVSREASVKIKETLSVKDYGAVGDNVADDTTAFSNALAALSDGGVLFIPPGNYRITGALSCSSNGITIQGAGPEATVIHQQSTTANTFVFSSTHFSGVKDLQIVYDNTATAGYAVVFNKTSSTGCFFSFASNLYIVNSHDGILIESCTETRISHIHLRGLLGDFGIKFVGTGIGNDASYRAVIHDVVGDVAGNGNTSIIWYCQDSFAYSLVLSKVTGLYGGICFGMFDSINSGNSYPIWCFADDLEADHNNTQGIVLSGGEGFYCLNSWIGSSVTGSGIVIGTTFRGEVDIGNSRIMGNAQYGILLDSGPIDVNIHDNMIGNNSTSGVNTYHGIVVGATATQFKIINNKIGLLVGTGSNNQGYGVFLIAGASTNFVIAQNNLTGNGSGALSDNSTGTGYILDNIGYRPAPAAVTVVASPMVYTAGHTPETLFIKGGTMTATQSPSGIVYYNAVTNISVPLAPNEQVVLIYSAAPTLSKKAQ